MRMHDVVDLVTSEPPPLRHTVDDIVEAGQRVQRRRRIGWVASGASAAVALGVVVSLTLPSVMDGRTAQMAAAEPAAGTAAHVFPAPAAPFTFTFGGYRVGKLRVAQPIDVSTAYQLASVYADGLVGDDKSGTSSDRQHNFYAYLAVYQPGAYDPTKLAGARHVTIDGRPGLETTKPSDNWAADRILAWQYSDNAWAVIRARSGQADYPSAADLRQLAAALAPAAPAAAKVPIKMAHIPSGYHLDEVGTHAMAGLDGIASARDGDYAGLLFSNPALATTGLTEPFGGEDGVNPPGSFEVFVVPAGNSNQRPSPGITCENGFCNRWAENGTVDLQVASEGRLSNSEMTKILNGITLGNVHDDSTWTEVSAAIG